MPEHLESELLHKVRYIYTLTLPSLDKPAENSDTCVQQLAAVVTLLKLLV